MPDTTDAYTHRIGRTGRAEKTGDAFTFITREDEDIVRSIERVLGEKVERRMMKGFDYKKTTPARDTEFARTPRLRTQPKTHTSRARSASTASQKRRKGGSAEGQKHGSPESRNTVQRVSPAWKSAGSATRKYR